MTDHRTRRRLLAGIGTASGIAIAGCLSGEDDENDDEMSDDEMGSGDDGGDDGMSDDMDGDDGMDEDDDMDGDGMDDDVDDPSEAPLESNPVAENILEQPRLGPEPDESTATIVVFEDPSCPRCAAFHDDAIAELKAEHVDSGELTIVTRPYPVVYDWGEPASHALEATFDRDEDAFWDLLAYYYDEQGAFDADNVLDRTESWLEMETDLDAAAIVEDAREAEFEDRIEATLEAAESAGAGGITPVTYLFRDGDYRTKTTGTVTPLTITSALEL